jgi:hypothetical protein
VIQSAKSLYSQIKRSLQQEAGENLPLQTAEEDIAYLTGHPQVNNDLIPQSQETPSNLKSTKVLPNNFRCCSTLPHYFNPPNFLFFYLFLEQLRLIIFKKKRAPTYHK